MNKMRIFRTQVMPRLHHDNIRNKAVFISYLYFIKILKYVLSERLINYYLSKNKDEN